MYCTLFFFCFISVFSGVCRVATGEGKKVEGKFILSILVNE